MASYEYTGPHPVPDGQGGMVRPGDIVGELPDFGPFAELPEDAAKVHPGTGGPTAGTEHPADGTPSPAISNPPAPPRPSAASTPPATGNGGN